jgi:hypothetical protein
MVTAELHTANLACYQRKIQLSGFSAYPDGWSIQFMWIIGILLYWQVSQVQAGQIITKRCFPHPHNFSKPFNFLSFFKTKLCTHFSSLPQFYLNIKLDNILWAAQICFQPPCAPKKMYSPSWELL